MSAVFDHTHGDLMHLSELTRVSVEEIERIYADEVCRLAAEARIQTYVGVIAIGRTRELLRRGRRPA